MKRILQAFVAVYLIVFFTEAFRQTRLRQPPRSTFSIAKSSVLLHGRSSISVSSGPDSQSDGLVDFHDYVKSRKYVSSEQKEPGCIVEWRKSMFQYVSYNVTSCALIGRCCACHNLWMSTAPCCGKNICKKYGIIDLPIAVPPAPTRPPLITTTSIPYVIIPPPPRYFVPDSDVTYSKCTCRLPGGYHGTCSGGLCEKPCCACALRLGSGLPCCGSYTCSKYGISLGPHHTGVP